MSVTDPRLPSRRRRLLLMLTLAGSTANQIGRRRLFQIGPITNTAVSGMPWAQAGVAAAVARGAVSA